MRELNMENDDETQTNMNASFGDRLFASIIDIVIINGFLRLLLIPIVGVINNTPNNVYQNILGVVIILLIQFLVYLGYFAVFAYYRNGQTLGKKLLKIKVVSLEGEDLSLNKFLFRELVARGVLTLGVLLIGKLANLWYLTYLRALSKDSMALHDLVAKTKVIKLS
jgi:uncharacterized RDD family membrane protein YckC